MGQARPDLIEVVWDNPPGPSQGLTLIRHVRGRESRTRVAPSSPLTQIETAAVLGCTLMTVNRYVRSGVLKDQKRHGISMIRLSEVKRFMRERARSETQSTKAKSRKAWIIG